MNGKKGPPPKPLLNSHRVSKLIFSASSSRWIRRGPVAAVLIGSSTHAARGRPAHTPLFSALCVCLYGRRVKNKNPKKGRDHVPIDRAERVVMSCWFVRV